MVFRYWHTMGNRTTTHRRWGLRTPASSIFFLDKHLAIFAIFISRLATSRKYAQNERVL